VKALSAKGTNTLLSKQDFTPLVFDKNKSGLQHKSHKLMGFLNITFFYCPADVEVI